MPGGLNSNGDADYRLIRRPDVRVLLIEDSAPIVRAVRQGLEEEGFAVDVATDGEEGDVKARTTSYDVIVLDRMLPKVDDGLSLLARIRALIRRGHQQKDPVLRCYDLEIDTAARQVKRAGTTIHLTPREYALLEFLAFHRGKVVTRSMIWEHLYDEYDENTSNVVDVYIRYLRNKVDKGFEPQLILTRWGEGYMLRGDDDPPTPKKEKGN
jgi:DNA-binding response OmpR family regulator